MASTEDTQKLVSAKKVTAQATTLQTVSESSLNHESAHTPAGQIDQSQAEIRYLEVLRLEQLGPPQTEADAQTRVSLLVDASNEGFAPASTLLGQWHFLGHYVKRSIQSAVLFFQHGAQLDHGLAHLELAYLGLNGASDRISTVQALMHLQKAVQLNHPEAIFVHAQQVLQKDPQQAYQLFWDNYAQNKHENSLKFCVEFEGFDPIKVQNDLLKIVTNNTFVSALLAFSYLRQNQIDLATRYATLAQEKNDPFGTYLCALIAQSQGNTDPKIVQDLLLKAAQLGHIESAYLAAVNLIKQSDEAKSEQKSAELAGQAAGLLSHAAQSGNASAQYSLAQCLRLGVGVEKNVDLGVVWLERAAMQNNTDAQFELAMLLPLEHQNHLPLLSSAAGKGHVQAMLCMSIYEQRQKNAEGTLHWLNHAKALNVPRAYFLLAQLYQNGSLVEADLKQSADLFKQAAELGDVDAYFELFKIYRDGVGVRKNKKTASKYLDLAKESQHIEAASIEFD